MTEDKALVDALESSWRTASLSNADRAMLEYSIKLTRQPGAIQASDIQQLREKGFDDRAIHDICCIVAYFAFANRVADGLGIEIEKDLEKSPKKG